MNHIQSTKNFQIKGLFYIVFPLFFLSCSPTLYVLDNSPNLAGNIYKKTSVEKIQKKLKEVESDLTVGRVLVRPSGTESKIRIMVESDDEITATKYAKDIAQMFKK